METVFSVALGFLFFIFVLLNVLGLPGNWFIFASFLLMGYFSSQPGVYTWTFYLLVGGMAVFGEVLEFVLQSHFADRHGASKKGIFLGIICAFIGGILGAPFFLGIGALFGALLGAYTGCLAAELFLEQRDFAEAKKAALGAMLGKFAGVMLKISIGAGMATYGLVHI